ncbi:MAG: hypothetical protein FJX72_16475, partial [Armatimonadetes bacterium]|nr:hypothetical protein [Armatimonadota bacterium]
MGESLSTRKQRILHAVVSDYITTAEPVGSEWLATRHDFGCRSATLRSEMGEMVDEGYLVQPHTSAGRIPTTVGYRYYVDRLMTPMPPDRPQRLAARRRLAKAAEDVRNTIRDACRLLAELTQYPSVASAPTNGDVVLHRLYLAPAGAHHVLLVLLLSTGHVENRVVELTRSLTDATLSALIHRLNGRFAGRSVQDLANQARVEPRPGSDGDEVRRICSAVSQAAAAFSDQHLFF